VESEPGKVIRSAGSATSVAEHTLAAASDNTREDHAAANVADAPSVQQAQKQEAPQDKLAAKKPVPVTQPVQMSVAQPVQANTGGKAEEPMPVKLAKDEDLAEVIKNSPKLIDHLNAVSGEHYQTVKKLLTDQDRRSP